MSSRQRHPAPPPQPAGHASATSPAHEPADVGQASTAPWGEGLEARASQTTRTGHTLNGDHVESSGRAHEHDHDVAPGSPHKHRHDPAHGHGHAHGPMSHNRAFAVGIALNLTFVGVEAYYGWTVGSLALLADAGHNLSDVAGLLLAWAGALAGRVRPDDRHTYGWRRASILAAFFNALLLLVAMGSLAWEAVGRLSVATPVSGVTMMVVAGIGIVVNGATALLFMRGSEHDLNIRGAFIHMVADALVSLGVVIAGALALLFAWSWIDPVTSLAIAAVIVIGTWRLFRQSLHLMFDGVPDHVDLGSVRATLMSLPGVAQVDDLHVWAMGTTQTALTAHLVLPQGSEGDAFLRHAVKQLQEGHGIAHVTLQITRQSLGMHCDAPR